MISEFVFWGASGHAIVLADLIEKRGGRVVALFDNNSEQESPLPGVQIWYGEEGFLAWRSQLSGKMEDWPDAALAIGGAKGEDRRRLATFLSQSGLRLPTLIHQGATVSSSAHLGQGSQVLAGAIVGPRALLGQCVIVNSNASVDHECVLEDGVHVAPGATLCGCIRVGENSLIGPNAVVVPRVKIGSDVVIGAGAVVTRDVPDGVVAWGAPARIVRGNE